MSNHPPCQCGCGELADECAGANPNPLGSIRINAVATGAYVAVTERGRSDRP